MYRTHGESVPAAKRGVRRRASRCDVDDESVDITVGRTGGGGTIKSPRLDIQLKCSSQDLLKEDGVHLRLKRKNYDDLRATGCHVPKILVVLLVPLDEAEWCENAHETEMKLRRNAWWSRLVGVDPKENVETPTVVIPRAQHFDVQALNSIMDRVAKNEFE